MECERCEAVMVEERLAVAGGLVKLKGVSAWHCGQCGRVEYKATPGGPDAPPAEELRR